LYNNASGDDLSTNTFSFGGTGGGGQRSIGGASIYASQRNQYFMNRKQRRGGEEAGGRVMDNLPANRVNDSGTGWVRKRVFIRNLSVVLGV